MRRLTKLLAVVFAFLLAFFVTQPQPTMAASAVKALVDKILVSTARHARPGLWLLAAPAPLRSAPPRRDRTMLWAASRRLAAVCIGSLQIVSDSCAVRCFVARLG